MGTLSLIGMGLHDENGITLQGIDAAKRSDVIYIELYTSIMPGLSLERLQRTLGKSVSVLSRRELEEDAESTILENAKHQKVALLTPGDPMSATTHVGLLLSARQMGISTIIIHAASIITAAAGATGLEVYKFGRTVTIPSPATIDNPESLYDFIMTNKKMGLHTLGLLDLEKRPLTIPEAIQVLLRLERGKGAGLIRGDTLIVGLARVGAPDCLVRADRVDGILEEDFGGPPWSIILPSRLHFMEVEALQLLAGAPRTLLEDCR
jgi:diphthine synthase